MADVRRLHRPTREDFERVRGEPVVLTGLMDDWPLLERLRGDVVERKLECLDGLVGHRKITYTAVPPSNKGRVGPSESDFRPNFKFDSGGVVELRELLRVFRTLLGPGGAGATAYMQSTPLRAALPELAAQTRLLPLLDGCFAIPSRVWLGAGGHTVMLHHDPGENFICIVEGYKRALLFPPEVLPDLYLVPLDLGSGGAPTSACSFTPDAPDVVKFPRLAQALPHARVAVVGPGEVLYLPRYWWHHIESFGLNLMVNTWTEDPEGFPVSAECFALLGIVPAQLHGASGSLLAECRAWFLEAIEGKPAPMPSLDAFPEARKTLARTAELLARAPRVYRTTYSAYYDYFVFRTQGDPFPTVPGAYEKWIERVKPVAARMTSPLRAPFRMLRALRRRMRPGLIRLSAAEGLG